MKTKLNLLREVIGNFKSVNDYEKRFIEVFENQFKKYGCELNIEKQEIFIMVDIKRELFVGDIIEFKNIGTYTVDARWFYIDDNLMEILLVEY